MIIHAVESTANPEVTRIADNIACWVHNRRVNDLLKVEPARAAQFARGNSSRSGPFRNQKTGVNDRF